MNVKLRIMIFVVLALFSFTTFAYAEDVMLDKKVERVTLKKDKNGNPFAILIVKDTKELNGMSYTGDIPVFAFGEAYADVKNLKKGDQLKAIAAKGTYNGQPNYRLYPKK
jgi:hypothetical protein